MNIDIEIIDNVIQPKYVELGNGKYQAKVTNIDLRTDSQNSSQWLWFTQIANKFNDNNIRTEQVIKPDIKWTKEKIKAMFFDSIMDKLYGKKTTTKLNKGEYTQIIDIMVKAFGEKGVELPPFPNKEMLENR